MEGWLMEWAQVLAIVLPVMFTIIIGIFYNNRRIDDLRNDMNQKFADMNQSMNQRLVDMNQSMNQRFAEMHEEIREVKNLMMEFLKKESVYTIRDK